MVYFGQTLHNHCLTIGIHNNLFDGRGYCSVDFPQGAMGWCLQYLIVIFSYHTHLLFAEHQSRHRG